MAYLSIPLKTASIMLNTEGTDDPEHLTLIFQPGVG